MKFGNSPKWLEFSSLSEVVIWVKLFSSLSASYATSPPVPGYRTGYHRLVWLLTRTMSLRFMSSRRSSSFRRSWSEWWPCLRFLLLFCQRPNFFGMIKTYLGFFPSVHQILCRWRWAEGSLLNRRLGDNLNQLTFKTMKLRQSVMH